MSAFLAVIVTALVTWLIAQKQTLVENVTRERAKWRGNIRDKAIEVHKALVEKDHESLFELKCQFRALLNPRCEDDNDIVACIRVPDSGNGTEVAEEFAQRIALLLKHDWERAKLESKFIFRFKCLRELEPRFFPEPKREKYK